LSYRGNKLENKDFIRPNKAAGKSDADIIQIPKPLSRQSFTKADIDKNLSKRGQKLKNLL
jgi:hypothetical protein